MGCVPSRRRHPRSLLRLGRIRKRLRTNQLVNDFSGDLNWCSWEQEKKTANLENAATVPIVLFHPQRPTSAGIPYSCTSRPRKLKFLFTRKKIPRPRRQGLPDSLLPVIYEESQQQSKAMPSDSIHKGNLERESESVRGTEKTSDIIPKVSRVRDHDDLWKVLSVRKGWVRETVHANYDSELSRVDHKLMNTTTNQCLGSFSLPLPDLSAASLEEIEAFARTFNKLAFPSAFEVRMVTRECAEVGGFQNLEPVSSSSEPGPSSSQTTAMRLSTDWNTTPTTVYEVSARTSLHHNELPQEEGISPTICTLEQSPQLGRVDKGRDSKDSKENPELPMHITNLLSTGQMTSEDVVNRLVTPEHALKQPVFPTLSSFNYPTSGKSVYPLTTFSTFRTPSELAPQGRNGVQPIEPGGTCISSPTLPPSKRDHVISGNTAENVSKPSVPYKSSTAMSNRVAGADTTSKIFVPSKALTVLPWVSSAPNLYATMIPKPKENYSLRSTPQPAPTWDVADGQDTVCKLHDVLKPPPTLCAHQASPIGGDVEIAAASEPSLSSIDQTREGNTELVQPRVSQPFSRRTIRSNLQSKEFEKCAIQAMAMSRSKAIIRKDHSGWNGLNWQAHCQTSE